MTPLTNDADVDIASQADIEEAAEREVTDAGVTLAELQQEAATGQFSSDRTRRAWFMVSPVAQRRLI